MTDFLPATGTAATGYSLPYVHSSVLASEPWIAQIPGDPTQVWKWLYSMCHSHCTHITCVLKFLETLSKNRYISCFLQFAYVINSKVISTKK